MTNNSPLQNPAGYAVPSLPATRGTVPRYPQFRTTGGWAPRGTKEYASYQQRKPDIHHGFAGCPRNLQPGRLDMPEGVELDKNRRAIFFSAVTALSASSKRIRLAPRYLVINRHRFPLTVPHKYRPAVSIMKRIQRVETYIQPAAAHIAQHRGGITVNAGQDKQKPRRAVNSVQPESINTSNRNGPNLMM